MRVVSCKCINKLCKKDERLVVEKDGGCFNMYAKKIYEKTEPLLIAYRMTNCPFCGNEIKVK